MMLVLVKNAVMYFNLLKKFYTFFLPSIYRWNILKFYVKRH